MKKMIISLLLFIGFTTVQAKADEYCNCIVTKIFDSGSGHGKHYTAQCYLDGKENGILVSKDLQSYDEANKTTEQLMQRYKIKEGDCVTLPDGRVVLLNPASSEHPQGFK